MTGIVRTHDLTITLPSFNLRRFITSLIQYPLLERAIIRRDILRSKKLSLCWLNRLIQQKATLMLGLGGQVLLWFQIDKIDGEIRRLSFLFEHLIVFSLVLTQG